MSWFDEYDTDITGVTGSYFGGDPNQSDAETSRLLRQQNDALWNTGYFNDVFADYSNEGNNYPTTESTQGSGGSPVNSSVASSGLGIDSLTKLFKSLTQDKSGNLDYGKIIPLIGGLAAMSRSNQRTMPSGYQGGIPTYTATRQAPGAGQKISGNVTYTRAAEGGELRTNGFIFPADVVSHLGNGSSDAGLKVLASKLGATPIKGAGDGMSDSIPTTIDGKEKALVAHEEAYLSPEKVARIGGGDAKKGAQKLRQMMERIREARTGTKEQGKQINPNRFMPGGEVRRYQTGGTTTGVGSAAAAGVTGTESNLSNWAGPYVTDMLAKGKALSEMPFEQYSGPLTAGPSALQTQAFNQAANLQTPTAIGQAAQTAGDIAQKAQNLGYTPSGLPSYTALTPGQVSSTFQAPDAYQAGQFANQFNAPSISQATQFTNQFASPQAFQTGTFGTDTFGTAEAQRYMNPFLQAALAPQLEEARRQAEISRVADASRLTRAGALGGGRQALMESEGQRNLATQLAKITGEGYTSAFDRAAAQFNADQARRLQTQQALEQSRQFGAQQGMTAAQLQAQYGLSAQQAQEAARQFNQGQGMTAAQLQAQYGLSAQQAQEASRQFGAQQALQAATTAGQQGLQAALANQQAGLTAGQSNITAALEAARQAEQSRQFGSTLGLQGLQTAMQAAQTQGQLGATQQQADIAGLKALSDLGATQRGISVEDIAAQKAQFEEARLNPYKMVQFQQSLLSGLPLAAQTYNMAPTNDLTQFGGGVATLAALLKNLGIQPST